MTDVSKLVHEARNGQIRSIARLISMVENDSADLREAMALMAPDTGRAHIIGLTGSPGVGKSTTTAALVHALRAQGQRVGVLAVDPSSPFSGGALLGDRVRMQRFATDPGVYIRSMASRGHLGGLSAAAPQALRVFDAAGFDTVLVETVGVGQSEVEIASAADTTLVLLAPGMGDGIQAAKAGILEIGDVFVVNKADRDGAPELARELRNNIALGDFADDQWQPPIVSIVASCDEHIDDLLTAIEQHRRAGEQTSAWSDRRLKRAQSEIESLVLGTIRERIIAEGKDSFSAIAADVRDGKIDPYSAADHVLATVSAT
ncbi:MAG: methylmalonyl Co-A mutase-associated GTPase MeaB [Propionibacteriaceae bacterium]